MNASSVAIAGLVMALIQVFKPMLDTVAPRDGKGRTAFYQGLALLINAVVVAGQALATGAPADPLALFLSALGQGVVSVGAFHLVTGPTGGPTLVLVNGKPVPLSALQAPANAPVKPDAAPFSMREG